jgi:poly(3-hydroxybutyrate) depolymerase
MFLLVALVLAAGPGPVEAKIEKQTFTSGGIQRTVYTFVPEKAAAAPAPLIITLHGSGRDGKILVDHWKDLASKEGIILAGPDATIRDGWDLAKDGPEVLHDLVEDLKARYKIDDRRVYIFGHSAGAIHGLALGVLESEYFAAIAAHAGVLQRELGQHAKDAPRKLPIGMWVGTTDRLFPVDIVRATHTALKSFGYPAELTEIPRHTHDYYSRAGQINKEVWAFLQRQKLEKEPRYQEYAINK